MFRLMHILVCSGVLLWMLSCDQGPENISGQWPESFIIGYTPTLENVDEELKRLDEFRAYVEAELGIPVELYKMRGYATTIGALRADKIDLATLGSFAFVIAEEKADIEPLIMRGMRNTGEGIYHSVILTRRDGYNSLAEVKQHAGELKMTFGNPASTSGHLIPRAAMENFGFAPETDFKEVLYNPEHSATLMSLLSGTVDVAAMSESVLLRFIGIGTLAPEEVNVLWKSSPIPTGPVVVRKNLPEDLKQAIQRIYLELEDKNPEIFQDVIGSSSSEIIFWPAESARWDTLRIAARRLRDQMYQ